MNNKPKITPKLNDLLDLHSDEIFYNLNCVKIGKIISFNKITKTASIQILFKRLLPTGNIASYPLLVDCPVFTLQGGGGAIQFPIVAGDQCIVLFSDRNLEAWFQNGSEAAPANDRAHDLSDGIALIGLNALNSALAAYTNDVVITIPTGYKLQIIGTTVTAEILGTLALALKSEVDAIITAFNQHVHLDPVSGSTAGPTAVVNVIPIPAATGTTKLKAS